MITGTQIKAARKLLGWSALKLSQRAKMHTSTVHRAECVEGEPPVTTLHAAMIRVALEAAGVEFTNGDEPGVKLKAKGKRAK